MTNRKVVHEFKLETSVKVILGVLAIGVCLNAVAPALSVKEAIASLPSSLNVSLSGSIMCSYGCK